MSRREDEKLLQQLAGDVARLMDENALLREALVASERGRRYWLSVAADRQERLLAAPPRRPRPQVVQAPAEHATPAPAPTLGLPGDDAADGQERAA